MWVSERERERVGVSGWVGGWVGGVRERDKVMAT